MGSSQDFDATAFKKFEHAGWESAAKSYQAHFAGVTMQAMGPLLDSAGVGNGTRVLDVATGPGHVAGAAAERGAKVTGLDFSAEQLAFAQPAYSTVTFQEGDAEALPFADESFDAVVMNFGMLHFPQPERALSEANRVLCKGGKVAFTVWTLPDKAIGFGIILAAIETHGDMNVPLPPGPSFFQFSDPETSRQALLDAGFTAPHIEEIPQVWRLASPDMVFQAVWEGAVRTRALLAAQTPEALDAIRVEIQDRAKAFEQDGMMEIPMPAILASAEKV